MTELEDQLAAFKAAMSEYELIAPSMLSVDAKIHRCNVKGYGGKDDGAYFLANFGGYLTGWYHNWQLSDDYVLFTPDTKGMSQDEKNKLQEEIEEGKRLAEDEARERAIEAKTRLRDFLSECTHSVPNDHPYCKAKKIGGSPGVKVGAWPKGATLSHNYIVIPIHDENGKVISCQGVSPEGTKTLFYGAVLGSGRYTIGNMKLSKTVIVTESYSNAYSLNKALDIPVVVSFGTGRMLDICYSLRRQYPEHKIIIAADNDYAKKKPDGSLKPNAGVISANKILAAIPEICMIPSPEEEGEDSTDWNEHINKHGFSSAKEYFAEYIGSYQKRLFYSEDLELSAPEWLIKGLLEKDSLGCMYGESGAGKSYIAVEMACCIASGTPFLGDIPVKEGMVVYVVGEGYRGFTRRRHVWKEYRKESNPDLHKLIISKGSFQLLNTSEVEVLTEEIDTYAKDLGQKPALVIIDTLARNFGDGDENATQDMNSFINIVDRHLREKYNCCVLIVHHTGHDKSRARGNVALKCALDTELSISKSDTDEGVVLINATKTKDGSVPPEMAIAFDSKTIEGLVDNFGESVGSAIIRRAMPSELGGIMDTKIGAGVTYSQVRDSVIGMALSKADLAERVPSLKGKEDHVLAAMVKAEILKLEEGLYTAINFVQFPEMPT